MAQVTFDRSVMSRFLEDLGLAHGHADQIERRLDALGEQEIRNQAVALEALLRRLNRRLEGLLTEHPDTGDD